MVSSTAPKRHALLVGVDVYLNDGSRRHENGNALALKSLRGCVNDVRIIRKFLRDLFQLHDPTVLTSTKSLTNGNVPQESEDRLPTYHNIKKKFNTIYEQAQPGDLFFFHFSGHGAPLRITSTSPAGRSTDPSLLPADYCCGKPALRGWQLNQWLKRFNKKKVQVIVILDSCHSGGAWRGDCLVRSPEDWDPPPNLDVDEAEVQSMSIMEQVNRNAELSVDWDINPEGFTLMAACRSNEQAAEKERNGVYNGAFTSELVACFNRPTSMAASTYRVIRDHIASKITKQTPQVFGRDRLAFFGNHEPFSATPVLIQLQGMDDITLPIGKVQGVKIGAQFATYPPTMEVVFSVVKVDEDESRANVLRGSPKIPQSLSVVPRKWSTEERLNVFVEPSFGQSFQEQLYYGLHERIVGDINVVESSDSLNEFQLKAGKNGHFDIWGPAPLLGYEGPVRGLRPRNDAKEASVALAHIFRFGQILSLRNEASEDPAPFQVTLQAVGLGAGDQQGPFLDNQKFTYKFENKVGEDLHIAIITLGPGFYVRQEIPQTDYLKTVPSGNAYSMSFRLTAPDELKRHNAKGKTHRDIVRTFVTRGKQVSLKSLELAEIWKTDHIPSREVNNYGRDFVREIGFCWWTQDIELFTVLR